MKKLFLLFTLAFLTACESKPHWLPIQEEFGHKLGEENTKYNGKIYDVLDKIENDLSPSNTYATEYEIEIIRVIQEHMKNAIFSARDNILNYPLENSYTKTYKTLELLKQRKITFAQAVQLEKYHRAETERAMSNAQRSVMAQQQASWARQTQHIGQGLGKTQYQIQKQQEYQNNKSTKTTCYNYGGTIHCDSFQY